jgi:uncharacterized protein
MTYLSNNAYRIPSSLREVYNTGPAGYSIRMEESMADLTNTGPAGSSGPGTRSPKEASLERRILRLCPESLRGLVSEVCADPEIHHYQEYANTVSIKRLGFNDHGPVHMRKVTENALTMAGLLHDAGVQMSLEREGAGTYTDSLTAIFLAAFLHDIGMGVTREDHENYSALLAQPILKRILRLR